MGVVPARFYVLIRMVTVKAVLGLKAHLFAKPEKFHAKRHAVLLIVRPERQADRAEIIIVFYRTKTSIISKLGFCDELIRITYRERFDCIIVIFVTDSKGDS